MVKQMMSEVSAEFDSEDGPVYRSEVSGGLFVVVSRPGFGSGDNDQVELRRVTDGEWHGVFQDNFRKGYAKVADTIAGVEF